MLRALARNYEIELLINKLAKYRKKIDFDHLTKLSSYEEKVEYLKNIGLQSLNDVGSSRLVFILSSKKALKLAKDQEGIKQNKAEVDNILKFNSKFVPKYYDSAFNYSWIIVELVRPLSSAKELSRLLDFPFKLYNFILFWLKHSSSFEEFLDNEFKEWFLSAKRGNHWLEDFIYYCGSSDLNEVKKCLLENQILKDFVDFLLKTNLSLPEIRTGNLGINSDGHLVVLDLGGTKEIMKQYHETT